MDCSPPDSSVHGILQARILEWIAVPFSSLAMEMVSELEVCVLLLDTMCFSFRGVGAGNWEKAGVWRLSSCDPRAQELQHASLAAPPHVGS